jgi:secreted PhoX family phosphatase
VLNCAGGTTPWGSWLSCEETETRAGEGVGRDHGWVFEVPARHRGLVEARPLLGLGRFAHEAATVDPRTGIVYLTEDKEDGLFYRFLPNAKGELHKGGRLQALALRDRPRGGDTRNWKGRDIGEGAWKPATWIDMAGIDNPHNDLRQRGHAGGAALFARGEGIEFGKGEMFFTCTSGGAAKLGQVMRYRPSPQEGNPGERDAPGMLQLFVESTAPDLLNYGDNITVAPWGHLIVCEDQYSDPPANHLRGITPEGRLYTLARLRANTEPAGACFSPDGSTMFVNVYSPTKTLAITGPWRSVQAA